MKRKIFSILVALALVVSFSLVTAVPVGAQDETWELIEIANLPGVGNAGAIWVKDNYAYVTTWDGNGLKIVDISDPSNPIVATTVTSPFGATNPLSDLCIQGNYAYVLDYGWPEEGGLFIVNISDPLNPSVVGSYPLPSGPTEYSMLGHIYVSGDYAYVGDWGYGLGIIDISDPTDPWSPANDGVKGVSEDPFWYAPFDPWHYGTFATGVYAIDNYAYVTSWDSANWEDPTGGGDAGGVWVVDVTDPTLYWYEAWPAKFVNAQATEGLSYDVVVHNGYAYVAEQDDYGPYPSQDGYGGLTIIPMPSATEFGEPIYIKVEDQIHDVANVDVHDDLAFIADNSYGLSVLDVSDPSTINPADPPILAHINGNPENVFAVASGSYLVYVADGAGGLTIYHYGPPEVEFAQFTIDHAKIDFKKKPDDDKVRVKGKLEIDTVNGDGVDISDDVTVTVEPLSETITMEEKGKKDEKWQYKRPKDGEGNIKCMTINWKNGKFDIRMDKADLSELTNPVTISVQIGDDVGSESILMREKKHHWDYKAPK